MLASSDVDRIRGSIRRKLQRERSLNILCFGANVTAQGRDRAFMPIFLKASPSLLPAERKYVREEVVEQQFTELLGKIRFDQDVLEWVRRHRESLAARRCDAAVIPGQQHRSPHAKGTILNADEAG